MTTKEEIKSIIAVKPPETIIKANVSGPPKRHQIKPSTGKAKTIPLIRIMVKLGFNQIPFGCAIDRDPTPAAARPPDRADPTLLLGLP